MGADEPQSLRMLGMISQERLEKVASDVGFLAHLEQSNGVPV